jgi:hypothetical protein
LGPIVEEDGVRVLVVTCSFRFEVRSEDQVVELEDAHHHTALVCLECLVLLTVHRRVHRMKVEQVIAEMAELGPVAAGGRARPHLKGSSAEFDVREMRDRRFEGPPG